MKTEAETRAALADIQEFLDWATQKAQESGGEEGDTLISDLLWIRETLCWSLGDPTLGEPSAIPSMRDVARAGKAGVQ